MAVIVAVSAVRMMEMPPDQVVHMIAVGDGGVAAVGTVHMVVRVSAAGVRRRASVRVFGADIEHMVIHMPFVIMV